MGQWGQGLRGLQRQEQQELRGREQQQELSGSPQPRDSMLQRCLASCWPLP